MIQLNIAIKNTPFQIGGIDKPLFFDWKTYFNNKNDYQKTILDCQNNFFSAYFNTNNYFEVKIASKESEEKITINIDDTSLSSNYFYKKLVAIKGLDKNLNFVRYYWISDYTYFQKDDKKGSVKIFLEIDYWLTYHTQILFNNPVSILRRMPNRLTNTPINDFYKFNLLSLDNTSQDNYGNIEKYLKSTVFMDITGDNVDQLIYKTFGFNIVKDNNGKVKSATFYYALVLPLNDVDQPHDFLLWNDDSDFQPYPLGCFIAPLVNAYGQQYFLPYNTLIRNSYFNIGQIPASNIVNIVALPVPPFASITDAQNLTNLWKMQCWKAKSGQADDGSIYVYGTTAGPGGIVKAAYPAPFRQIGINNQLSPSIFYDKLERGLDFSDYIAPSIFNLGVYDNQNEPVFYLLLNEFKHYNVRKEGAALNLALLNNPNDIISLFYDYKVDIQISGSVVSYTGVHTAFNFYPAYYFMDALDYTIPSGANAWQNYINNNKNSWNTGLANQYIGMGTGLAGIAGGALVGALGGATLGAGAILGLIGIASLTAINSLKQINATLANKKDMEQQANDIKNRAPRLALTSQQMDLLAKNNNDKTMNLSFFMWDNLGNWQAYENTINLIIKHARIFGNPIQEIAKYTNLSDLAPRIYWNYWEIENFSTSLDNTNFNGKILMYFDELFKNGIRLWNTTALTKQTYLNYELENWEKDLALAAYKGDDNA